MNECVQIRMTQTPETFSVDIHAVQPCIYLELLPKHFLPGPADIKWTEWGPCLKSLYVPSALDPSGCLIFGGRWGKRGYIGTVFIFFFCRQVNDKELSNFVSK